MKKVLLLLTGGILSLSAAAQQNTSIMFAQPSELNIVKTPRVAKAHEEFMPGHRGSGLKTTNHLVNYNDWFYYANQNFVSGTSVNYFFNITTDSNIYDVTRVTATFNGYNNIFGLGMSFDPTDPYYYAQAVTPITEPPIIQTTDSSTPYMIDSFLAFGRYIRNNPSTSVVDSLIIDLIPTTVTGVVDSGVYKLQFQPAAINLSITADSTPRFASAIYTAQDFVASPQPLVGEAWDSIKIVEKQRYAFPLTAANVNDTDANGENVILFALTTPMSVRKGQKVVSSITFKSGVAYPFGTPASAANSYHLFAGDPSGASTFPQQAAHNNTTGYAGSYQDGLINTKQTNYVNYPTRFTYQGHPLLIPACAYLSATNTAPTGFEVPDQAFHVMWSAMTVGVTNTNKAITAVNAYPNPATAQLNISYAVPQGTEVTVTLTNMLGQTVATQQVNGNAVSFNTAAIPAGIYVYAIVANGDRTTGRVVVAH